MKKKIYNTSAICLAALGSMAISHVATANKLYAMDETVVQQQAPDHSQQVYQASSGGRVQGRSRGWSKQQIAKTTCFSTGCVSLAAGLLAVGLCASVMAWITGGCFIALGAILLVSGMCIKEPASASSSIVISSSIDELIDNAKDPAVIDGVTDAALEKIINDAELGNVFKCTKAAVESGNIGLLFRLVRNPKVVLSMATDANETDPLKKTALGLAVQKCIAAEAGKADVYVSMVRELLVREMNADQLNVPTGPHKAGLEKNAGEIVTNVDSIAAKVADGAFKDEDVKAIITALFAKDGDGKYKAQKWFSEMAPGKAQIEEATAEHFYGLKNEEGKTALMVNLAAETGENYQGGNLKILCAQAAEMYYTEEGKLMLWAHIANDKSNICHYFIDKVIASGGVTLFSARSGESDALSSLFHKILELQCREYIEDPQNPKKNIVKEISVLAAGDKDGQTFLMNILKAIPKATAKKALKDMFGNIVWRDLKQKGAVDDSQPYVSKKRLRRKAVQKATGAHVNDHDQMASGHVDNDGNGLITTYISIAPVNEVLDKDLMRLCIFAPGELDIGTTEQVCGRAKQCKLALKALLERGQTIEVEDQDFASYVVMLYEKQVDSLKVLKDEDQPEEAEGNLLTGKAAYDHLLSKCNDKVMYKAHITSANIEKFTAQLNHDFAATTLNYDVWMSNIGSQTDVSKVFQHYINKEGKTFVTHFYAKCLKELQDCKGSEKQSKFTSMTSNFAEFLKQAKTETEPNDLQGETVLMLAIKDFLSGDEQAQAFAEKVIFLDAETANENLYMQPDTLAARNFEGQNSMDLLIEHGVPALQELQSVLQKTKAQEKMSAEYNRAYARYHKILKCAYKLNESLNSKRQDIRGQYPLTLAIQKKCPSLAAIFVSKDGASDAATQAKEALKTAVELDAGKDLSTEQGSLLWKCALSLGVNGSDYAEPKLAAAKERVESLDEQLTEEEESKWHQLVANDAIRDADGNVIAQNASYYGGSIDNNQKTALQCAIDNYFSAEQEKALKLIQALLISPEERLQNIKGKSVVQYIVDAGYEQNKDADTKNLLALFSPDLAAAGIIPEKYSSKLPETMQLFTEEAQQFIQSIDTIDSNTDVTGFESSKFPSVRSASGDTALMKAAAVCNDTIVTARVSVEQGQRSYAGLTAMMYAATSKKDAQSMPQAVTIIGQLYDGEKGIVSHEGKTALMYAINNSELNGSAIDNATIIDALLKGEELAAGNALLEAVMLCGDKDSAISQKQNRAELVKKIIDTLATKTSETAWIQTIRDKQATEAVKKLQELVVPGHALHGSLSAIERVLRAIGNVEDESISYANVKVADFIETQRELQVKGESPEEEPAAEIPEEREALEEERSAAEMTAEKEAPEDEGANEDLKEDMTL